MTHFLKFLGRSFTLLLILSSCSTPEEGKTTSISSYELQVIDSISFNRLSEVWLHAYDEATKTLLLQDDQQKEVLFLNEEGEVTMTFNPFVEGPDYVGDNSFGWDFLGEDSLVGYSKVQFATYSKEGTRGQRVPYPDAVRSWTMFGYSTRMLSAFETEHGNHLIGMISGLSKYNAKSEPYYDSVSHLYTLDLTTGEYQNVFRLPEFSNYRQEDGYIDSAWPLFNRMEGSTFALTYALDHYIYLYDAANDQLLDTLPIPSEFLPKYDVQDFGSKGPAEHEYVNKQILTMGDQIILVTGQTAPISELNQFRGIPNFWLSDEYKQLNERYSEMHFLLFDRDGFRGEIEWEIGPHFMTSSGSSEGYFWALRVYEEERDYRTFLKVKVVESTSD